MGTAASLLHSSHNAFHEDIEQYFIDQGTKELIHIFSTENNARISFAGYIKSGVWLDKLKKYELPYRNIELVTAEATADVWERFGYDVELSHQEKDGDHLSTDQSIGSETSSQDALDLAPCSCEAPQSTNDKPYCEVYPTNSTCFLMDELAALMIAALIPFYKRSKEYQYFLSHRNDKKFQFTDETSMSVSHRNEDKIERSNRLEEIFLMTAAYHEQYELIEKLKSNDWVSDYAKAIQDCPVSISLGKVTKSGEGNEQQLRTILTSKGYRSSFRAGDNFADFANEALMNENTKEAFYSALHNGNNLKTIVPAVTQRGRLCSDLVALQAIQNTRRDYKYMLGVHYNVTARKRIMTICQLQFMEDMLALMPLLLKFP